MSIPLGQFLLDDVAGSGGAGVVWRGRHAQLGLPVAVKVLPPKADRHALHAHKNEVQAVARLHHPHVVAVLDAGIIDAAASVAASSAGHQLAEGSPWFAMELATGGDLQARKPPFAWPVVSDVLRTLLSALAHAHARGVIHKDLKPQNVLLCTDDDVRPGLKLSDFGLALHDTYERLDGGTPIYMAPEQFDLDDPDLGPWTDLYALGCMAFWLTTGAPPFTDVGWRALAARHIGDPAPRLPSTVDAPPQLADWVSRLLEKSPARRYRCAADADAALAAFDATRAPPPIARLPDGLGVRPPAVRPAASADAATVMKGATQDTEILDRGGGDLASTSPRSGGASAGGSSLRTSQPPPGEVGAARPPSTWRTPVPPLPDLRLVEAGLSLWGLRPVPLVGRDHERDAVWQALLDVHAERAPRVVVVRGPSGVGKSRLAEWAAHRAMESGAARVLRATFQPMPGRGDGLVGLVARACGLLALEGQSARTHAAGWLQRWLPGVDITPEELCGLAGRLEGIFTSGEDRQSVLLRLLSALAQERPLYVWLDDVHDGRDALALVARVMADAPELPVLFVATAVDELIDDDAARRLEELAASGTVRQLRLKPLDESAHDELCARLLGGASGGLTDALRRRTEGNALFAVQVVGDWISRGLLEVREGGLALKPGTAAELPDALHALWDRRIAVALGDALTSTKTSAVSEARRALEVAAVLGSSVDLVEWEGALQEAHMAVAVIDRVIDALAAAGLARRTEAGFQFAHIMVRSSVERRAREQGRHAGHHACAARALAALWGSQTPSASARIGRHLLAAGAPVAALRPLLAAARAAVEEAEMLEAGAVLADWERARAELDLDDTDARVPPGLLLLARVAHQQGRHDESRALASRAALASPEPRQRAAALRIEAEAGLATADLEGAVVLLKEALELSTSVDDKSGMGAALRGLGDADYWRGDFAAAATRYRQVADLFAAHGKKTDLAQSLWSMGYVEMERQHWDEAQRLFREQRKVARGTRDRLGEANAENALGELARRRDNLDEAEKRYRTAARLASKNGLSRRWVFRLNQAHVRVLRGDAKGAGSIAAELIASPAAREPMVAASCWWIVAIDAAGRGDLPAWDKAADEAERVPLGDMVEMDLHNVAQGAGNAVERLDKGRAERAWRWARDKRKAIALE